MPVELKKIGLFGGSFNPVQNAHLMIARIALEKFNLDKVFFIPASQSPFKPEMKPAPGEQRLRLLRLALAGESKFAVDDQEVKRGGLSYTIETVRNYRAKYPFASLYYIIGADHLSSLPKWKESEKLAELVEFLVFTRPNEKLAQLAPIYKIHLVDGFYFSISSTLIRERIRNGLSIKGFVPEVVDEIIKTERLYTENNSLQGKSSGLITADNGSVQSDVEMTPLHGLNEKFNSCFDNSGVKDIKDKNEK